MAVFNQFPRTHHQTGIYDTVLGDGTRVTLQVSNKTRALRGNELYRAAINMQMGRPASHRVTEVYLQLRIGRNHPVTINFDGMQTYRYGRHYSKSLKDLVMDVVGDYAPSADPTYEDAMTASAFGI